MNDLVNIVTDRTTAICVIANIQLATRHPENVGPSRKIAEEFARELQARLIIDHPELEDVLEAGWNPAYDC
jgi:hypothetical protein